MSIDLIEFISMFVTDLLYRSPQAYLIIQIPALYSTYINMKNSVCN